MSFSKMCNNNYYISEFDTEKQSFLQSYLLEMEYVLINGDSIKISWMCKICRIGLKTTKMYFNPWTEFMLL